MLRKKASVVCCRLLKENTGNLSKQFRVRSATLRTLGKHVRVTGLSHEAAIAGGSREGAYNSNLTNVGKDVDKPTQQDQTPEINKVEKIPLDYKLYNSVIHAERREASNQQFINKIILRQTMRHEYTEDTTRPSDLSVAALYLLDESLHNKDSTVKDDCLESDRNSETKNAQTNDEEKIPLQYPYAIHQTSGIAIAHMVQKSHDDSDTRIRETAKVASSKRGEDRLEGLSASRQRIEAQDERRRPAMHDEEDQFEEDVFHESRYGTPDPTVPPSAVGCAGCGALLHCQSTGLPGYIPRELFVGASKGQLRTLTCQRCHFLKEHDVALNVSVGPEEYPRLLKRIHKDIALVVLVVDLLDFPCSIWPGLVDIIGRNRPICVVGNKVDLLPRDEAGYLGRVRLALETSLKKTGVDTGKNIKHVALVSAKSGFGIEELITSIQSKWGTKGDIYLVGCTNVGKSTLFNALLQSDLCKSQAVDIIQRATTSVWPGTTLNLLKFPLLRPSPHRIRLRMMRLKEEQKWKAEEIRSRRDMLRQTKDPQYASLISRIGLTFYQPETMFARKLYDGFSLSVKSNPSPVGDVGKVFNPKDFDFASGKWCYDTPGAVHNDQIISLLTIEELNLVLPKDFVRPKTFALQPNCSLFLAGLGRIDYIEGKKTIRLTVFSAPSLPVTIIPTVNADEFYQKYFGTHVLKVPCGSYERLRDFPPLCGKEVVFTGTDREQSCADIVLSSAGWVAVTAPREMEAKFKVFTPGGYGCHFRQPAILPHAVKLRGRRVKFSPLYKNDKVITNY